VPLTVIVQDTQEGSLLVPEIWNGLHLVTGVVTVPVGMTLTIGSNPSVSTSVQFTGNAGNGYGQGLMVQGSLLSGISGGAGVVFEKSPNQT